MDELIFFLTLEYELGEGDPDNIPECFGDCGSAKLATLFRFRYEKKLVDIGFEV
jgi:hypothetical protein